MDLVVPGEEDLKDSWRGAVREALSNNRLARVGERGREGEKGEEGGRSERQIERRLEDGVL